MTSTLKVIRPFFGLEVGEIMNLSEDGKEYISVYNNEYREHDEDDTATASYSSTCKISVEYAEALIKEGYLEQEPNHKDVDVEERKNREFVNVFTEIDNMLNTYNYDLANIDKDLESMPECLKVEKRTVLENLIKALTHLKELKK